MDLNTIGHIGYVLVAFGTLLLATGRGIGWPIRLVGGIIWAWLGLQLGMSSVWFWESVFVTIDTIGCWQWVSAVIARTRTSPD